MNKPTHLGKDEISAYLEVNEASKKVNMIIIGMCERMRNLMRW